MRGDNQKDYFLLLGYYYILAPVVSILSRKGHVITKIEKKRKEKAEKGFITKYSIIIRRSDYLSHLSVPVLSESRNCPKIDTLRCNLLRKEANFWNREIWR